RQPGVAQTRVLASRARYDEVVDAISSMVGNMHVGDPADPTTDVGPLVARRQQERVEKYIALGQEEGARVVIGGNGRPSGLEKGWYVQPTVFAGAHNDMRIAREKIFGPVIAVIPYDDEDEPIHLANDSDYTHAEYVWATDPEHALDIAPKARTRTQAT